MKAGDSGDLRSALPHVFGVVCKLLQVDNRNYGGIDAEVYIRDPRDKVVQDDTVADIHTPVGKLVQAYNDQLRYDDESLYALVDMKKQDYEQVSFLALSREHCKERAV